MAMPSHFVLVRHGLSEGNFALNRANNGDLTYLNGDFQNRPGPEWRLMPEGEEQANRAGLWIQQHIVERYGLPGFDSYIYSPHRRTRETAAHLGLPGARWTMNRMLRERSWGEIELLSNEQYKTAYPRNHAWQQRDKLNWSPPGGESIVDIADGRVRELLDTMHRDHDQKGIDSVLAVAHGELMLAVRLVLEYMSNEDWALKESAEKIHNCQVVHYTNIDPTTNEKADYLRWVRSVNAGNGETGPGIWRENAKHFLTNEELLAQAKEIPRLW